MKVKKKKKKKKKKKIGKLPKLSKRNAFSTGVEILDKVGP